MNSTTRTFSLIPKSLDKKKIYKEIQNYLVKFRDLENIFVNTLVIALIFIHNEKIFN